MTRHPDDPERPKPSRSVDLVLLPRAHDVGGFEVRRALPVKERQMAGSFIFFDQMGPGEFLTGGGLDVRPKSAYRPLYSDLPVRGLDRASRQSWFLAAHHSGRRELDDVGTWHRAL